MPAMEDDWTLLARWREGDKQAGNDLVNRYFGMLSRFFHNKVSNPEDAADLISETLLACTKNKERIRDGSSFRSFMFAIAINQLRLYFRKKRKRGREEEDFAEVCTNDLGTQSMTSMVMHKREIQLLVQGLRTIPVDFQIALELNLFEGLSGPAISELLGIPTATVYSRLRLGKQRLHKVLEQASQNPDLYRSTVTDLQGWAQQVRARLDEIK